MKNKQCRQCHKSFQITDQDLGFYNRIQVDSPQLCPDCRKQKRLTYKNDFNFYQINCHLCDKQIISIYDPAKSYTVYCSDCWWSDKWDAMDFGRDYNFNQDFFQQFNEIMLKVPRISLINHTAENSDYCHHADRNKNSYLLSTANDNEDCCYGFWVVNNKNCLDFTYCTKCENCYELVDCENCYQTFFSQLASDCIDCNYVFDCRSCSNCVGCAGLRNAEYYIFNKQYSKQDFKNKIKSLYKKSIQKQFEELKIKYARKYIIGKNIIDSTGDRLYNCQNIKNSFDLRDSINGAFLFDGLEGKECYDCNNFHNIELSCDSFSIIGNNYKFSYFCRDSHDLTYCDNCHASKNLFACIGLKKQSNCIFNKPYSNQDYQLLEKRIIDYISAEGGSASGGKKQGNGENLFQLKIRHLHIMKPWLILITL
ncbi:MAG: hypothetical protein V1898_04750 [Patescibacteria group bacterium]